VTKPFADSPAAAAPETHRIRHVALDMDGTIYRGRTLFPTTRPFLDLLDRLEIGYTFLTNNPSRSRDEYLDHLRHLGLEITPDRLYTSTQATIEFLEANHPAVRRLFLLGTVGLAADLQHAGFSLANDSPDDPPDAVLVAFDTTLTYARLCRAAWWIAQGKPWFATNPDRVCPTDLPTVLVDCGSICAALACATGRTPNAVLGKPDPAMLQGILRRHHIAPAELAMVGDRLYTDIEMARRSGALGVLVLTGETTPTDAARAHPPPDLIVPDLTELGARLLLNVER
jgi:NagD protein